MSVVIITIRDMEGPDGQDDVSIDIDMDPPLGLMDGKVDPNMKLTFAQETMLTMMKAISGVAEETQMTQINGEEIEAVVVEEEFFDQ